MLFKYLSIFTGLCYILVGLFTIIYKAFIAFPLDPITSYPLGAVLIAYGIFRSGRVICQIRKSNQND